MRYYGISFLRQNNLSNQLTSIEVGQSYHLEKNKFISDKILENNKNISLRLEEIKFKFDLKNLNLFLETKNPELIYKNIKVPIEYTKVYLDFASIIKSNPNNPVEPSALGEIYLPLVSINPKVKFFVVDDNSPFWIIGIPEKFPISE